nr:hypothetical protein [Smithella sp.]
MPTKTEESAAVIAAPQKSDFAAWIDEFKTFNEQSLQIDMEYIGKRQAVSQKYSGDERDRAMAMLETERQMAQEKIKIKKQEYENFSVISENEKAIKEWTKAFQTFSEQRLAIEEDFNNKAKALREKYDGEQEIAALQQLETERQLQLDRLAEQENNYKKVQELDEETGKILEKNLNKLSVSELKNLKSKLSEKQKIYKNNTDLYIAITEKIEKVNDKIWDKEIEQIKGIGKAISALSDFVGKFDEDASRALNTFANLIDKSVSLAENMGKRNYLAAAGDFIQIIASFFDKTEKSQKNYEQMTKSFNRLLQKQYELLEKINGVKRIEETAKQVKSLERQIEFFDKMIETTQSIMEEEKKGSRRRQDVSQAYKDAYEMQKVYKENREAAKKQLDSLQAEYREFLTGISRNSFVDNMAQDIVTILSESLDKTEDFAKSFEEIMRDMFVNTFKQKLISDFLDNFYEQWAESAKDGMTPEELAALNASFNEGIDNASAAWQAIVAQAKAAGIDLMNEVDSETATASKNSLKGAIQGITEDTASLLAGQFNAIRINVIDILNEIRKKGTNDITGYLYKMDLNLWRMSTGNLGYLAKMDVNLWRTWENTNKLINMATYLYNMDLNLWRMYDTGVKITDLVNSGIKVKNFNQTGFEIFENIVM